MLKVWTGNRNVPARLHTSVRVYTSTNIEIHAFTERTRGVSCFSAFTSLFNELVEIDWCLECGPVNLFWCLVGCVKHKTV